MYSTQPIEDIIYERALHIAGLDQATDVAISKLREIILSIPSAYAVFVKNIIEPGKIDVVVDTANYQRILAAFHAADYELGVDYVLVHKTTKIVIDLLKEGVRLKDSKLELPHPRELGPNTGFATLPGLFRLKLDAGRMQDMADVVKLLIPRLDQADELSTQIPEVLRPKFWEMVEQARKEAK